MTMMIYFLYKTILKTTVVRGFSVGAPLFYKIKDQLLLESKQLVFLLLPVQDNFRRFQFNRKIWISVVLFALLTGLSFYLSGFTGEINYNLLFNQLLGISPLVQKRRQRTILKITLKKNNLKSQNFNNIYSMFNIHTSSIAYADNNPAPINLNEDHLIEAHPEPELRLVLHTNPNPNPSTNVPEQPQELELTQATSSFAENFPWFVDENNNVINYNKTVDLFKAVKYVNHYITTKYGVDSNSFSNMKISELIKIFEDKKEVTIFELYQHVSTVFTNNKKYLVQDIIHSKESALASTSDNTLKPFGQYGEITINQLATDLLNLDWETYVKGAKITLHAAPLAMNIISYSLILRAYVNIIHKRSFPSQFNPIQIREEIKMRNRSLMIFALIGAPMTFWVLRGGTSIFKDLLSIEYSTSGLDVNSQIGINNPNENSQKNTSLLLLISKGIQKLPDWLKFLFFLISLGLFVLKLFGYNFIDIFIDDSLLVYIIYGYSSLAISYFLLHLYLLHKFYKAKVNIPEILPKFITNWLEGIKILASNEVGFKTNRETVYLNLIVYIIIIFIVTIFK